MRGFAVQECYWITILLLLFGRQLPESCQKVLFSATYSDEVMDFAKRVVPDPIMIRLKRSEESLHNIKQVSKHV